MQVRCLNCRPSFHLPILSTSSSLLPHPLWVSCYQGPIANQTTANILNHISAALGDFWLIQIQTWNVELQEKAVALDTAKSFFLLTALSEDNKKLLLVHVQALKIECMLAKMRNHNIPDLVQTKTYKSLSFSPKTSLKWFQWEQCSSHPHHSMRIWIEYRNAKKNTANLCKEVKVHTTLQPCPNP